MKTFEKILRRISVLLGYISSVFFAIIALLFVSSFLTSVSSGSGLWGIFLGGTLFCGIMAWLFFRSARKQKTRDTWTDRIRAKNERNIKAMTQKKACPDCGQRLDVCDQTPQLRINPIRISSSCEYYCPICNKKFGVNGHYADYIAQERDIPQIDGEAFRPRRVILVLIFSVLLIFSFLGVLYLIAAIRTILTFQEGNLPENFKFFVLLQMSLISLFFLGMAFALFKIWNRSRIVFFRLMDSGLVSFDGIAERYFMWEDFRIAQYLPKAYIGKPLYAFDTKEHQFAVTPEVKDYKRLCEAIMEKVSGTGCRILREQ